MTDNRYVALLSAVYSSEAAELVLHVTAGHLPTEQAEFPLRSITVSPTQVYRKNNRYCNHPYIGFPL